MRFSVKLLLATCIGLAATSAMAVDDGPRAYFPVPVGTNNFNFIGLFQDSNSSLDPSTAIKGADLSIDVGILQYSRTFDVGGKSAGLVVVAPFGEVKGSAVLQGPLGNNTIIRSTSSSGLGDVSLVGVLGLVGSPALTRQQYAQYVPGFSLGAMLWATAPTGEYDGDKLINLGTNRWAFRVGTPLGWTFGGTYLSPKLTTLEFVPSVTFYTDNTDPFRANRVTQSELYRIEAHLTHNFTRAVWGSLDLTANDGARTTTDGQSDNNRKTWAGAGITAGVNFSPAFGLSGTYGRIISGNSSAPEGDGYRINLRYTF